ncbi:SHOCT domain-containing protein [Pseudarthrobacter phenanthrenivorans]|uniref:SHOCT domain-containing protein n=1 Tax=Pseudarthrobacter phenanthrenivorans TaxID=361575 RepID=UPI000ADEDC2C|nr:SHOCT domain-containing protein [Pseudarthrobacter phenanthrenivorans]
MELAATPAAPPSAALDSRLIADELTKLAGLRDAGVLTEDEFAAQKAKLLG